MCTNFVFLIGPTHCQDKKVPTLSIAGIMNHCTWISIDQSKYNQTWNLHISVQKYMTAICDNLWGATARIRRTAAQLPHSKKLRPSCQRLQQWFHLYSSFWSCHCLHLEEIGGIADKHGDKPRSPAYLNPSKLLHVVQTKGSSAQAPRASSWTKMIWQKRMATLKCSLRNHKHPLTKVTQERPYSVPTGPPYSAIPSAKLWATLTFKCRMPALRIQRRTRWPGRWNHIAGVFSTKREP